MIGFCAVKYVFVAFSIISWMDLRVCERSVISICQPTHSTFVDFAISTSQNQFVNNNHRSMRIYFMLAAELLLNM